MDHENTFLFGNYSKFQLFVMWNRFVVDGVNIDVFSMFNFLFILVFFVNVLRAKDEILEAVEDNFVNWYVLAFLVNLLFNFLPNFNF